MPSSSEQPTITMQSDLNFGGVSAAESEAAATRLRDLLARLLNISRQQLAALDHRQWRELHRSADETAELHRELHQLVGNLHERGLMLTDPIRPGEAEGAKRILEEARRLARRLDAHEKYVLRQVAQQRDEMAELLKSLSRRRRAQEGYGNGGGAGRRYDRVR